MPDQFFATGRVSLLLFLALCDSMDLYRHPHSTQKPLGLLVGVRPGLVTPICWCVERSQPTDLFTALLSP